MSTLARYLVSEGRLTDNDCQIILRNIPPTGAGFAKAIVALGILDELALANFLAMKTHFPVISRKEDCKSKPAAAGALERPLLESLEVVPLELEGKNLTVAMMDPLDHSIIQQLKFFTPFKIKPIIACQSVIYSALAKLIEGFRPFPAPLENLLAISAHHVQREAPTIVNRQREEQEERDNIPRPSPGPFKNPFQPASIPAKATQQTPESFEEDFSEEEAHVEDIEVAEEQETSEEEAISKGFTEEASVEMEAEPGIDPNALITDEGIMEEEAPVEMEAEPGIDPNALITDEGIMEEEAPVEEVAEEEAEIDPDAMITDEGIMEEEAPVEEVAEEEAEIDPDAMITDDGVMEEEAPVEEVAEEGIEAELGLSEEVHEEMNEEIEGVVEEHIAEETIGEEAVADEFSLEGMEGEAVSEPMEEGSGSLALEVTEEEGVAEEFLEAEGLMEEMEAGLEMPEESLESVDSLELEGLSADAEFAEDGLPEEGEVATDVAVEDESLDLLADIGEDEGIEESEDISVESINDELDGYAGSTPKIDLDIPIATLNHALAQTGFAMSLERAKKAASIGLVKSGVQSGVLYFHASNEAPKLLDHWGIEEGFTESIPKSLDEDIIAKFQENADGTWFATDELTIFQPFMSSDGFVVLAGKVKFTPDPDEERWIYSVASWDQTVAHQPMIEDMVGKVLSQWSKRVPL